MNVKQSLISAFVFLFFNSLVMAQMNSYQLESLTTRLFSEKKWDSLKLICHQEIKKGTDYFYLRYRLGIAYYQTKNYRLAAQQFEKAYMFNKDNHYLLEYMYYSYLFGGRDKDAQWIAALLPRHLKMNTNTFNNKWLRNIYTEGGISLSNNFRKNQNTDVDGIENIFGSVDLNNNILYSHIGTSHQLGRYASAYHGFSYIYIDKKKIISVNNHDTTNSYKLNQTEYYLNFEIVPIPGIKFTPYFHGQWTKANTIDVKSDPEQSEYIYTTDNTSLSQIILGLTILKEWRNYSFGLSISHSNINKAKQLQSGLALTWFPYGNTGIYTYTTLTWLREYKQPEKSTLSKNRFIFDHNIGKKVLPILWMELGATFGNLTHYSERNGFIIYNSSDKINYRLSTCIIILASKQLELSLRYQFLNKETEITYNKTSTNESIKILNYQNQNILGGIKWKL